MQLWTHRAYCQCASRSTSASFAMMAPMRASLLAATSFFMICTSSTSRLGVCYWRPKSGRLVVHIGCGIHCCILSFSSSNLLHLQRSMLALVIELVAYPPQHCLRQQRICHVLPGRTNMPSG